MIIEIDFKIIFYIILFLILIYLLFGINHGCYIQENFSKENFNVDISCKTAPFACPAGTYCPNTGMTDSLPCPAGSYCPTAATTTPILCASGTFNSSTSASQCTSCPAGTYCPNQGMTGTSQCPAGSFCSTTGLNTAPLCASGTYSSAGSTVCTSCPAGTYCPNQGSTSALSCPPGKYCPSNTSNPLDCPVGSYCPANSTSPISCSPGHYCASPNLSAPGVCPIGSYCPTISTTTTCPVGFYCPNTCPTTIRDVIVPSYYVSNTLTNYNTYDGTNSTKIDLFPTFSSGKIQKLIISNINSMTSTNFTILSAPFLYIYSFDSSSTNTTLLGKISLTKGTYTNYSQTVACTISGSTIVTNPLSESTVNETATNNSVILDLSKMVFTPTWSRNTKIIITNIQLDGFFSNPTNSILATLNNIKIEAVITINSKTE